MVGLDFPLSLCGCEGEEEMKERERGREEKKQHGEETDIGEMTRIKKEFFF